MCRISIGNFELLELAQRQLQSNSALYLTKAGMSLSLQKCWSLVKKLK